MIEILFVGIISGIISGFLSFYFFKRELLADSEDLEEELEDVISKFKRVVVPCRLEFVNDTILIYNRETDEFITQGKSFEELENNLKSLHPEKYFDVKEEEIKLAKNIGKNNE